MRNPARASEEGGRRREGLGLTIKSTKSQLFAAMCKATKSKLPAQQAYRHMHACMPHDEWMNPTHAAAAK